MRQAQVLYKNTFAGIIRESDEGFVFQYDREYLASALPKPVSLTLPLQQKPFVSNVLFPFFDGLIPEGWLLNIASESWKITKNDRMGLLLACCQNAIGAVSVHPLNPQNHE
jgi:serine/threonine-protein kinase HipA